MLRKELNDYIIQANEFIRQLEKLNYSVYESCVYKEINNIYCKVGKIDFINKIIVKC